MWSAELVIIESQRRWIIKMNTKRGEEEEEGNQRLSVDDLFAWFDFFFC